MPFKKFAKFPQQSTILYFKWKLPFPFQCIFVISIINWSWHNKLFYFWDLIFMLLCMVLRHCGIITMFFSKYSAIQKLLESWMSFWINEIFMKNITECFADLLMFQTLPAWRWTSCICLTTLSWPWSLSAPPRPTPPPASPGPAWSPTPGPGWSS